MGGRKNINIGNARPGRQKNIMEQIQKDGVCPFCAENLPKYHKNPILKEGKNWLVTENQWPYDGSALHMVLISKSHAETIKDLKPEAKTELFDLIGWVVKKYKLAGGAVMMRFGDTDITGATVTHLHCHIIRGGRKPKKKSRRPRDLLTAVIGYKYKKK